MQWAQLLFCFQICSSLLRSNAVDLVASVIFVHSRQLFLLCCAFLKSSRIHVLGNRACVCFYFVLSLVLLWSNISRGCSTFDFSDRTKMIEILLVLISRHLVCDLVRATVMDMVRLPRLYPSFRFISDSLQDFIFPVQFTTFSSRLNLVKVMIFALKIAIFSLVYYSGSLLLHSLLRSETSEFHTALYMNSFRVS